MTYFTGIIFVLNVAIIILILSSNKKRKSKQEELYTKIDQLENLIKSNEKPIKISMNKSDDKDEYLIKLCEEIKTQLKDIDGIAKGALFPEGDPNKSVLLQIKVKLNELSDIRNGISGIMENNSHLEAQNIQNVYITELRGKITDLSKKQDSESKAIMQKLQEITGLINNTPNEKDAPNEKPKFTI